MRDIQHFISGAAQPGVSGRFGEVFDPNTGEVQAKVALAAAAEVDGAVQAALNGTKTSAQAMKDAQKEADRILRSYQ